MQGPSIQAQALTLRLGNSLILNNMNFTVHAGSIHCLVGPNGGGKTSTLRCLLGQMPHQGDIRFDWADSPTRTIGYVPQLIELERTLPLTITDFLTVVSQNQPAFTGTRKNVRNLIDNALDQVGLLHKRGYMIGSLSGGERQRLLFAQALIPAPSLLVLDEPMTSMDEAGARQFEALIDNMHKQGTTILWINHDLGQVSRMADDITVIDRGVIATGPVTQTLTEDMKKGIYPRAGEAA